MRSNRLLLFLLIDEVEDESFWVDIAVEEEVDLYRRFSRYKVKCLCSERSGPQLGPGLNIHMIESARNTTTLIRQ